MADGTTRPISEVGIGDKVLATDPATGQTTAQPVTMLHLNRDIDLTDVTVSTAPAGEEAPVGEGKGDHTVRGPTTAVLHTTAHHPFWDATIGHWTDAAQLKAGESTLITPDGQTQYVVAVDTLVAAKDMRDLTVDRIHTYYVIAGETPVLVHNCNAGTAARGDACSCTPDTDFVRRGTSWESTGRLENQAGAAEAAGFPHGVSVTTPESNARLSTNPLDAVMATKERIEEEGFSLVFTPTRNDPNHHTLALPKPVTSGVAGIFNRLFGRRS